MFPSSVSPPRRRVLVAEPHNDTRAMYRAFFELEHWQVDEAHDGRVALALALGRHPDIIVSEVRLPGLSGFDLCRELRADPLTRSLPIVLVTSDASLATTSDATACGADQVLVKPCLPEELRAAIEQVLPPQRPARPGPVGATRPLPADDGRRAGAFSGPSGSRRNGTPERRLALVRAHQRHVTTQPSLEPPPLVCPQCDGRLRYTRSHIGGVTAAYPEQWDYYTCDGGCGDFQYRQRTRKLRPVSDVRGHARDTNWASRADVGGPD